MPSQQAISHALPREHPENGRRLSLREASIESGLGRQILRDACSEGLITHHEAAIRGRSFIYIYVKHLNEYLESIRHERIDPKDMYLR